MQEGVGVYTNQSCPVPKYWVDTTVPGTCTNTCVGDPINPGPGNVYKQEQDDVRVSGASPIEFRRFYNSADAIGSDMGPGLASRHMTALFSVNFPGQQSRYR